MVLSKRHHSNFRNKFSGMSKESYSLENNAAALALMKCEVPPDMIESSLGFQVIEELRVCLLSHSRGGVTD